MRLPPFLVVAAMVKTVFVFFLSILVFTAAFAAAAVLVATVLCFLILIVFHHHSPLLGIYLDKSRLLKAAYPQKANAIPRSLVPLYIKDKPSKLP